MIRDNQWNGGDIQTNGIVISQLDLLQPILTILIGRSQISW